MEKPKVLFCCLGNIIRSPICEGLLRHKYGDKVFADSAAVTRDDLDSHPEENAIIVAKEHGFDISEHISRLVTLDDFEKFDLIVSLERRVHRILESMKPKNIYLKSPESPNCWSRAKVVLIIYNQFV